MLSGDNSILQKATDAKENSEKAQIEERIKLAYHSSLVNGKGIVTEPSLESELKNEFNKTTLDEGWLDKTSVEGKWKITIDGVYLEVPAGSISTDSNSILGFGSVNDEYKIQFGHIVTGYGIEGTWRLFYADSNNVYLIRDSIGSSALNSFSWFGTSTISTLGENLNKKYTSWELKTNGTDLNNNIKATAALLDTTKWTDYVEEGVAEWAVGAPSLEMYIESYNATHTIQLDCIVEEGDTGYKVKKDDGSFSANIMDLGTGQVDMAMYSVFWVLASPSKMGEDYMMCPSFGYGRSQITYTKYDNNCPIRPLVCVPISKIGNRLTITENILN